MYVKKRMSLLLFAALAMVLFTACGRWDFSREAAKAANEAQGETLRVEFTVEQKFTNALRAALEENIQPADVEKAMRADESIKPFLTSGYRLDVYPLRADISAKDAAKQLAAEFVNRLAGCEDKGYISMVKADNGYFYEAVLTYRHGSSGGSSGGGDATAPTYTVTVKAGDGGTATPESGTITAGSTFEFTVTPKEGYEIAAVKPNNGSVNEDKENGKYTLSNVNADTTVTVTFQLKKFNITVISEENTPTDGQIDGEQGVIVAIDESGKTIVQGIVDEDGKKIEDGVISTKGIIQNVTYGSSISLLIQAKDGYEISSVTIEGTPLEGIEINGMSEYTLENITKAETIEVKFKETTPPKN